MLTTAAFLAAHNAFETRDLLRRASRDAQAEALVAKAAAGADLGVPSFLLVEDAVEIVERGLASDPSDCERAALTRALAALEAL